MYKKQAGSAQLIIVIVLVVLLSVGAGLFVWNRQNKEDTAKKESKNTSTSTIHKIAVKEKDTTETITEVDLTLQRTGDVALLPSVTPESFVEYMTTKINDFECDFELYPAGGFNVVKISPRFVEGGIGCEGGAGIVWYLTTAGWEELGFQSYVPCSTLVEYAIPSEFIESCYDDTSENEEVIDNPNGPLN